MLAGQSVTMGRVGKAGKTLTENDLKNIISSKKKFGDEVE